MRLCDEYPPSARFSTCFVCGASKRPGERLIDTGIHIDMEGLLVVCESCVAEMATMMGYKTDIATHKMEAEIANLRGKLAERDRQAAEVVRIMR